MTRHRHAAAAVATAASTRAAPIEAGETAARPRTNGSAPTRAAIASDQREAERSCARTARDRGDDAAPGRGDAHRLPHGAGGREPVERRRSSGTHQRLGDAVDGVAPPRRLARPRTASAVSLRRSAGSSIQRSSALLSACGSGGTRIAARPGATVVRDSADVAGDDRDAAPQRVGDRHAVALGARRGDEQVGGPVGGIESSSASAPVIVILSATPGRRRELATCSAKPGSASSDPAIVHVQSAARASAASASTSMSWPLCGATTPTHSSAPPVARPAPPAQLVGPGVATTIRSGGDRARGSRAPTASTRSSRSRDARLRERPALALDRSRVGVRERRRDHVREHHDAQPRRRCLDARPGTRPATRPSMSTRPPSGTAASAARPRPRHPARPRIRTSQPIAASPSRTCRSKTLPPLTRRGSSMPSGTTKCTRTRRRRAHSVTSYDAHAMCDSCSVTAIAVSRASPGRAAVPHGGDEPLARSRCRAARSSC